MENPQSQSWSLGRLLIMALIAGFLYKGYQTLLNPKSPDNIIFQKKGANVDLQDNKSKSALDYAAIAEIKNVLDTNSYKTIKIGNQLWMAENLNVSHFRNGDIIPEAKTVQEWLKCYENLSPAWCYYNNDPKNGEKYGKLYNWYAVNDSRGLAPFGWHIPTDDEWQKLIVSSGGMGAAFSELRKIDGFAAFPSGARDFKTATFNHIENITFWWSANNNDKWNAWYHAMHFGYKQVGRDKGGMNAGHSVRCIKNK